MVTKKTAVLLFLLLLLIPFSFANKDLIVGDEFEAIKELPVEEVKVDIKYCADSISKKYAPCEEFSKGETKEELAPTEKLYVSLDGTYMYDEITKEKQRWAERKEDALVYVHKVRIDEKGNRVYHVDNLNNVPVDAYVSFWYEQQPGMLWHQNKYDQIVRGYYPSQWTWVQEYTYSPEEGKVIPFGGTVTFLAYGLTENSVGSEEFLVGSFPLNDVFYGNDTIANLVNFAQNGSGFGKQFYPGNATNVTISDGAMVFNGNNSVVNTGITDNSIFNTSGFTLTAWINPYSYTSSNIVAIIDKSSSTTAGNGFFFRLRNDGANSNAVSLRLAGGSEILVQNIVTLNNYQHVVAVVDSLSRLNIYVNGIQVGTANFQLSNISNINSTNSLLIGNQNVGTLRFFNGSIDDVRIFNRALTATEVSAMYNQGRGSYSVIGNGLIAQYSGRDYNGTPEAPTTIYDTNQLVSSGPITIPNGTGVWSRPYNLTSKTGITFDGVNDYIGTNTKLFSNDITLSAWVNARQLKNNAGIISQRGNNVSDGFLRMSGTSGKLQFFIRSTHSTTFNTFITNDNVITDTSKYYHISVVSNLTHASMYIDGTQVSLTSGTTAASTTSTNVFIGRDDTNYFNGSIADVRIYNTSLTPAQVYAIYSGQNISTPAVFISSPTNGQEVYNTNEVTLSVTPSGESINSVWYTFGGSNITVSSPTSILTLPEGMYSMTVFTNNSIGQIASSTVSFKMGAVNVCLSVVEDSIPLFVLMIFLVLILGMVYTATKNDAFQEYMNVPLTIVLIGILLIVIYLIITVIAGGTC